MTALPEDVPAIIPVREVLRSAGRVIDRCPPMASLMKNPVFRAIAATEGAVISKRGMHGGIFMTPTAARAFAILLDPEKSLRVVLDHVEKEGVMSTGRTLWAQVRQASNDLAELEREASLNAQALAVRREPPGFRSRALP